MTTGRAEVGQWGRNRLLVTVVGVAIGGVGALGGLGYGIWAAITSADRPATSTATGGVEAASVTCSGPACRDGIAAAPMLEVSPDAGRGGTPAGSPAPTITIPVASTLGPADVPTGYPHTPEGAVGQLAAIEATVLQAMSIQQATTVHQEWSEAGAPPADTWELTANVQAFLGSASGQYVDDPSLLVVTTPVAAQVKGVDGQDWVVACVLLDVKATAVTQARTAYGHCERMQWDNSRWVIAAGTPPARAPSTWPGTDLAYEAGWRTWVSNNQEAGTHG
jgi:hypothetical protein